MMPFSLLCTHSFLLDFTKPLFVSVAFCLFFSSLPLRFFSLFPQARHISPQDSLLLFNLALVQRWSASAVLRDQHSGLSVVLSAVRELEMAQRWVGGKDKPYLCQCKEELHPTLLQIVPSSSRHQIKSVI